MVCFHEKKQKSVSVKDFIEIFKVLSDNCKAIIFLMDKTGNIIHFINSTDIKSKVFCPLLQNKKVFECISKSLNIYCSNKINKEICLVNKLITQSIKKSTKVIKKHIVSEMLNNTNERYAFTYFSKHLNKDFILIIIDNIRKVNNQKPGFNDFNKTDNKSEKLKNCFLQNLSHEIRTPLNGIVGFSELLSINLNDNLKLKKYTEIIKKCSYKLLSKIDDILRLSMIESGLLVPNYKKINFNTLFQAIKNNFNNNYALNDKEININILGSKQLSAKSYITDPEIITQIFSNLLSNAAKYTKKGKIEFGLINENKSHFIFCVSDTGMGISLKELSHIFENFHQYIPPDQIKDGLGLGLSMSKKLTEILGGKMWVESQPETGSSFLFTIPKYNSMTDIKTNNKPNKRTINKYSEICNY